MNTVKGDIARRLFFEGAGIIEVSARFNGTPKTHVTSVANLDQWIAQASVCVTSPYPCTHNVIAQHFRLLYCLPQRIFVRDSLLFVCLLSKEYCTIFVQIHSIRLEYSDNHGKGIRARRIGRKKTTLSWNERIGSSGGKPLLHGPDKNSSAKEQQRRRDATKIYLLRSYVNWQMEKELYKHVHDLTSVSNADFAEHLLQDHTKR